VLSPHICVNTRTLSQEFLRRIMYPGGLCPEKDRLLRKLNRAVDEHAKAAGDMSSVAGVQSIIFMEARRRAGEMKRAVRVATDDYKRHTLEHGC